MSCTRNKESQARQSRPVNPPSGKTHLCSSVAQSFQRAYRWVRKESATGANQSIAKLTSGPRPEGCMQG
jgi:hypothetical protein